MKNYFVYVLKCAGGVLYTGYTINPKSRLRLHNLGVASKFTRSRRPVKLVYLESFASRSEALKRELQIKRLKHSEKITLVSIRGINAIKPEQ